MDLVLWRGAGSNFEVLGFGEMVEEERKREDCLLDLDNVAMMSGRGVDHNVTLPPRNRRLRVW